MKYSINCGICNEKISVDAEDDREAMDKMKLEAKRHNSSNHPEVNPMEDKELEADIERKLTKE